MSSKTPNRITANLPQLKVSNSRPLNTAEPFSRCQENGLSMPYQAPTGRNTPAQGIALGSRPPHIPSPEGAQHPPHP